MTTRLDFGSGYNPRKGFKTCDMTMLPFLDYVFDPDNYKIVNCEDQSIDIIYCRNVLHHIPNLSALFNEFNRILKPNGRIVIIEPTKETFRINVFLDYFWYRWLIPRPEVWFASNYRDYKKELTRLFQCVKIFTRNEKELVVYRKVVN